MSSLRDQMEVLAEGLATSGRERKMAVDDSKVRTARMLRAFGLKRMAMAKDLKSGFAADRKARSVEVCMMQANTGTMCEALRQDHLRMGRSLRRKLVESTEGVAALVASLRADFAKESADFAKAHRHMTRAQRAGLARDRRDRSREVVKLMKDFHVSRAEMAQALAQSLAKSTGEMKSQVSGLNVFSALLAKTRENASVPSSMLAVQSGGTARVPFAALGLGPEEHQKKTAKKK